jgi:hypothetical protein
MNRGQVFQVVCFLVIFFQVLICNAQKSSFSAQLGGTTGAIVFDYFTDNYNFLKPIRMRPTASFRYEWTKLKDLNPSIELNYSSIDARYDNSRHFGGRWKLNYLFVSALINPFFLRAKDDRWSIHLGLSAGQLFQTSTNVFSSEAYNLSGFRSHVFGETIAMFWKYSSNAKLGIWAEVTRMPSPCVVYATSNADVCLLSSLRLSYTF